LLTGIVLREHDVACRGRRMSFDEECHHVVDHVTRWCATPRGDERRFAVGQLLGKTAEAMTLRTHTKFMTMICTSGCHIVCSTKKMLLVKDTT
jgi:hypothetical protein